MTQLLIVGVGLIGGSMALALKAAGLKMEIVGAGRRVESLQKALELGVVDRYETDLKKAAASADIVVLAVPMAAMKPVLEKLQPGLRSSTIVTDAGSVKSSFVRDAKAVLGSLMRVVPGHPIAGDENSGVEAAFASLFNHRRVILTPEPETEQAAIAQVKSLWEHCGAEVECLQAEEHDRVLAATSHLPHVLAYSLVDALLDLPEREAIFRYAAGGFRDFTRIASSDPTMWRDVCLSNRDSLLAMMDKLQENFAALRERIDAGDGDALFEIFKRSKCARDQHYE